MSNLAAADDWMTVETRHFTFSAPKDFRPSDVKGKDSSVGLYFAEGVRLQYDYGKFSPDFRDWPKETKYQTVKIHGMDAKIGQAEDVFEKEHPLTAQVRIEVDAIIALTMTAACKSEKDVALAIKIFQTIKIPAK